MFFLLLDSVLDINLHVTFMFVLLDSPLDTKLHGMTVIFLWLCVLL